MPTKPRLTVKQILQWADAHHARTNQWPKVTSGPVRESPGDTWCAINQVLRVGLRGLPGGSSLPRLLEEHRGVRNEKHLPALSVDQILKWADAHHKQTGRWPTYGSGEVADAPGESWAAIHYSLRWGRRGLPGGSTLGRLLAEHRGKRNRADLPQLAVFQILLWADAHLVRTGTWPTAKSGPVQESPGDTWRGIDNALTIGLRGLPGGSSLPGLLEEHRGVRHPLHLPRLSIRQIRGWAEAHRKRTGRWPGVKSGPIAEASGETWWGVYLALRAGRRGLPRGSSLVQILNGRRRIPKRRELPPLTLAQILAWADRYHELHQKWPQYNSGPVADAPGLTWSSINIALQSGSRGLPGGYTLARLLSEHRGLRNRWSKRRLTVAQILTWADEHKRQTGDWPESKGGPVLGASDESWNGIDQALKQGLRGLPGGLSLIRLLAEHRGVRNPCDLPRLSIQQILGWADEHRRLHQEWPQYNSGPIPGVPGETWASVNTALQNGSRGLAGKYTLARLLAEHRGLRNRWSLGQLTIEKILGWADEHKKRTGDWPSSKSGPVTDAPGESWSRINRALYVGSRGLAGGESLHQLLARRRHAFRHAGSRSSQQ